MNSSISDQEEISVSLERSFVSRLRSMLSRCSW